MRRQPRSGKRHVLRWVAVAAVVIVALARVHVVTAADDHVFLAVHDVVVAVLVYPGAVRAGGRAGAAASLPPGRAASPAHLRDPRLVAHR